MNQWENVMQKHAKSFHLASLFFPRHLLPKVKALYALCRWLDDAVDEAPNEEVAAASLRAIEEDLLSSSPQLPVNRMYRDNNLEVGYMQDLIQGARDDLQKVRIQNQEELIQYCYKVAGTVGLAMFDLLEATPAEARSNAVDLGIAMQITNICRDVAEDLKRDRIYIPATLLQGYHIEEKDLIQGVAREEQVAFVTKHLLTIADQYYASANTALPNIPWRARGAIIIASDLYRGIGVKLRAHGGNPLRGRTYLTHWEKLKVVSLALLKWGASTFHKPKPAHLPMLHQGLETWQKARGFH